MCSPFHSSSGATALRSAPLPAAAEPRCPALDDVLLARGALDCRASCVNDAIKLAATRSLAALARTTDGLRTTDDGAPPPFGRDYLIPRPTDERLLVEVSLAVAKAAMTSGVARLHLDESAYKQQLQDTQAAMDVRHR
jgi:malic enzyme